MVFVRIPIDSLGLEGDLAIPPRVKGLVIFAHGSGSSRHSPRNVFLARELQRAGFATLLFDLLTAKEDEAYENRFDLPLLARRLALAVRWARREKKLAKLPVGLFGGSTGPAAALLALVQDKLPVQAVVSRGGRVDLVQSLLPRVKAATLLVVGERDEDVLALNRRALEVLGGEKKLVVIPGASHLFEEPGALEQVSQHAVRWFKTLFAFQSIASKKGEES